MATSKVNGRTNVQPRTVKWSNIRVPVLLATAVIIVAFAATSFVTWAGRNHAFAVGTTKTNAYVELYFTQPNDLPLKAGPGQTQTFGFSLTNRHPTPRTITYQVQLQDMTGVVNISSRTIRLQPGETVRRKITYTLPATGPTVTTVVSISNKQSIRFYTQL
jgi:hypothetical protein